MLDTNVLVSALIFPGGSPEAAYRLARERRIALITSAPLLLELARVLSAKCGWEPGRAAEAVAQVAGVGEVVKPTAIVADVVDDPGDNRVLEAAASGRADLIVSGDRHLLKLGEWQRIPIIRPAELTILAF